MALMSLGQYSAGVGTRVGYSHCRNSRKATDMATGWPRSRSCMGTLVESQEVV